MFQTVMLPLRLELERSHLLGVGGLARLEVEDPSGSIEFEGRMVAIEESRVTLLFESPDGGRSPLLTADQPAVFKVWDRFGIYRAETWIHAVAFARPAAGATATATVTLPRGFVATQSRKFFRVAARLELSVQRIGEPAPGRQATPSPIERALTYDISAGGLSFMGDTIFAVGDRVLVEMVLPKEVSRFAAGLSKLDARVIRVESIPGDGRHTFGIEFQHIAPQQRDRLEEIMLGLQRIMR